MYTWDHRTSAIIWNILKVQPLLSDEIQAFKALILVHKVVKDGHPNVMTHIKIKMLHISYKHSFVSRSSKTLFEKQVGSRHALVVSMAMACVVTVLSSVLMSTFYYISFNIIVRTPNSTVLSIMKNISA